MPAWIQGQQLELVGVEDAARAFVLAATRGRPGERYIISDRMMSARELITVAAKAGDARPPRFGIPLAAMKAAGALGSAFGGLLRRDMILTRRSVRLSYIMTALDHSKATRELGWEPEPVEESIQRAARFYLGRTSQGRRPHDP
jgi:dihydroflavonol-4-reductase